MMDEEDDDFYDPSDAQPTTQTPNEANKSTAEVKTGDALEEGEEEEVEEEEEDDEDDFKIITEAPPPRASAEPVAQPPRQAMLRNENRRSASLDPMAAAPRPGTPAQQKVTPSPAPAAAKPVVPVAPTKPGSAYPAQHTSTIDVNANPVLPQTSKSVLTTDLDTDFPTENDKPWRQPGSDITDYFNYGFDEFTWASYCLKQQELRKEVGDQKKQMEDMQAFLGMPGGGMPGMSGGPPQTGPTPQPQPGAGPPGSGPGPGPQGPMGGMPSGMPEMSQEMMQGMLGAMMAQGLDPTSMDPMTFMQHAQAMMGGGQPGGGGAQGGQPGFGGQPQGQGFGGRGGGPQQMGYGGYDQRGGFGDGGRGRGGRRW